MLSVRRTFTLAMLLGALLPVFIVSHYYIERQSNYLLNQKEAILEAAEQGIKATVYEEFKNLLDLSHWFSTDRFVLQSTNNLLYSSVMWRKMDEFSQFTSLASATYILDKDWDPIYQTHGSLYYFEQSELFKDIQNKKINLFQGKTVVLTYKSSDNPLPNSRGGIAIVSPMLAYQQEEFTLYNPFGYVVNLVEYDSLNEKIAPFLFGSEFVVFSIHEEQPELMGGKWHIKQSTIDIDSDVLAQPLSINIDYHYSDQARLNHISESESEMNRIMIGALFVIALVIYFVNKWISIRFVEMNYVATAYSNNHLPNQNKTLWDFEEFRNLKKVLENMFVKLAEQMDRLELQNQELETAKAQVEHSNRRLETFNDKLASEVTKKTSELTYALEREESQKRLLVDILDYVSELKLVGYRGIPRLASEHLTKIVGQTVELSYLPLLNSETITARDESVLGYLQYPKKVDLTNDQQLAIDLYVKQLASWLELESMARMDKLTYTLNRKAYDEDMEYLEVLHEFEGLEVGVVVIDVNGLKQVNDDLGHHVGDQLITACKEALLSVISDNENLYRVGGDEFVIVSSASNLELVEKLKGLNKHISIDNLTIPVRFAIGSTNTSETRFAQLFQVADENMYQDKQACYAS